MIIGTKNRNKINKVKMKKIANLINKKIRTRKNINKINSRKIKITRKKKKMKIASIILMEKTKINKTLLLPI